MIVPILRMGLSLMFLTSFLPMMHAQQNHVDEQVVSVSEGRLKGIKLASGVSVFKGIPYAVAPVGNLRWKRPMPWFWIFYF
jgi:para-nitrobenzyl esterase